MQLLNICNKKNNIKLKIHLIIVILILLSLFVVIYSKISFILLFSIFEFITVLLIFCCSATNVFPQMFSIVSILIIVSLKSIIGLNILNK